MRSGTIFHRNLDVPERNTFSIQVRFKLNQSGLVRFVFSGEREWVVREDDFDVAQELARSRFADMILDYDRNDQFLNGLKSVIAEKKSKGDRTHVLDIGTGTGLLSLMAAREGADQVTALEVFKPMAQCATQITQSSQWKDKITVIGERSTDLSHLGEKPNIIVAEVFDTELIGEGALRTFKEALENLVQPNCRVIPNRGRVWILPVESEFLRKFNRVPRLPNDQKNESPLGYCTGSAAVFDVQLSLMSREHFRILSDPVLAFDFSFDSAEDIHFNESFTRNAVCTDDGTVDALLMWWDIDMDYEGEHFISMAPDWAVGDSRLMKCSVQKYAWRDHWMQAVYYTPGRKTLKRGEEFRIQSSHDEYSLWFSMDTQVTERHYCSCVLHSMLSRYNVFRMNDLMENDVFRDELDKATCGISVVAVGEGSLIGLMAAHKAREVVVVDTNSHFRRIVQGYIDYYGLQNVKIVASVDEVTEKPDVVVAEPFYLSSSTPWENLRFWRDANQLRTKFGHVDIYPSEGVLCSTPVQFEHLQNTAAAVGTVNGFDLGMFDQISHKAREATDAVVDDHCLWEYAGRSCGPAKEIARFPMSESPQDINCHIQLDVSASTNGLPLWMEWKFGDYTLSTGLLNKVEKDDTPSWNVGYKQGVYLLPENLTGKDSIYLRFGFDSKDGSAAFHFTDK